MGEFPCAVLAVHTRIALLTRFPILFTEVISRAVVNA
jgi:hypothetical protein